MAQTLLHIDKIKDFDAAKVLDRVGNILTGQTAGASLLGVTTNSNAGAGVVGEILSTNVAIGSAVALTTATTANVATLALTAGDWDVWANIMFIPAASTSITVLKGAISTTTATLPTAPNGGGYNEYASPAFVPTAAGAPSFQLHMRQSLSATTNIFLVAQGTFTVAALTTYGFIGARRAR